MKAKIKNKRNEITGTTDHVFNEPVNPWLTSIYEMVPRNSKVKAVKITYVIAPRQEEAESEVDA